MALHHKHRNTDFMPQPSWIEIASPQHPRNNSSSQINFSSTTRCMAVCIWTHINQTQLPLIKPHRWVTKKINQSQLKIIQGTKFLKKSRINLNFSSGTTLFHLGPITWRFFHSIIRASHYRYRPTGFFYLWEYRILI